MKTIIILFSLMICINPVFALTPPQAVLKEINTYRASKGLKTLVEQFDICKVANERVMDIVTDWSHSGFYKRVLEVPRGIFVENLARGFNNPKDVVIAWENSPTHNVNLLADVDYGCVSVNGNLYTFEGYRVGLLLHP